MKVKRLQTPDTFVLREQISNHEELFTYLDRNIPWQTVKWVTGRDLPRKVCHEQFVPPEVRKKLQDTAYLTITEINRHRHLISPSLPILSSEGCGFFCNRYADGSEYTPFHEDNYGGDIVSFSFGATRNFQFKNKNTNETESFELNGGDVLYFAEHVNLKYKHSVPVTKKQVGPRVNITFFLKK